MMKAAIALAVGWITMGYAGDHIGVAVGVMTYLTCVLVDECTRTAGRRE